MPAQKRSHEPTYQDVDDDADLPRNESENNNDDDQNAELEEQESDVDDDDDDGSTSSSSSSSICDESDDEFVYVKLAEIRKEVQCPICLGIIRKTRTVMECLHRFCRECIDKSMRLGNNECPACRAHCASRRSLRDDPNYDALIAVLYPDIDKYEAEEYAFHEEEKARNKQIQESIAQTSRRQLEALGKKRTNAKATAAVFTRRSNGTTRNPRGRRNQKSPKPHDSDSEDDDDDNNDRQKDSSSDDEPRSGLRTKRQKKWGGSRSSQPSLPTSSGDGGCDDNDGETTRDVSGGLFGSSEILTWGRGGMRSNTRHGSLSNSAVKNARGSRVLKQMDHLRKLPLNNDKLDIHLKLISLDVQNAPNLQHLYLCCSPTMQITHLGKYVALEKGLQDDEIELLVVKEDDSNVLDIKHPEPVVTDGLQLLEDGQTLVDVAKSLARKDLTLAYRKKLSNS
ncbi:putative E3 ubiquitin-protein ligase RING1a [Rutidosis leptorrhynchoides]|uniref:putative E3 ubiquitin-protein ligase RING1a n=1 Tax=Rutidosis leptorrhynchoides TaxID=125765 RepID=UPI003A9A4900